MQENQVALVVQEALVGPENPAVRVVQVALVSLAGVAARAVQTKSGATSRRQAAVAVARSLAAVGALLKLPAVEVAAA